MIFFLAMTDAQRGEAFATGVFRLILFGGFLAFGLRFVITKVRGKGKSESPDEDPKASANNDPSRSGRPRF
jgi:hypothetical protein